MHQDKYLVLRGTSGYTPGTKTRQKELCFIVFHWN